MEINVLESRSAGYANLLERLRLAGMLHWRISVVSSSEARRSEVLDGTSYEIYPKKILARG